MTRRRGVRGVVRNDTLTASSYVSIDRCRFNRHPIYLKAIALGPVPVAINGVVRAVSIPVVALIAYIDTVLPLKLTT